MDATWQYLSARLSGRALRVLVDRGLSPGAAARLPSGELEELGLEPRERHELRRAADEAARGGPRASCGRVVCPADAEYPAGFFRLARAPGALWMRGALTEGPAGRVALVGARRATRSGRLFARELAAELAGRGIEVWSGLARGVDAAGHEGALTAGRTAAVLGSGLDVIYPPEHRGLLERVCARGAVLTEFSPGTRPQPAYFPQRNRLIAAAAEAVLVVEAGVRSGALTTVNWALELEVPVLVAPGDPRSESCGGSNELLRAGATPLLDASDVLAALGQGAGRPRSVKEVARGAPPAGVRRAPGSPGAAGPAHPLLEALRREALHVDDLAARWPGPGPVGAELVRLELDGRVEALGGGFYAALER
ncbi:MAG TPA: DNA-processing protein DprA [Candidatus Saccharimonadales bacterium]|nr:DNA-processing protein DprA [Candidatus Saccharimonadales bacterium]